MLGRRWLGTAAVFCAALALALPVAARDAAAPKGASERWLPCESWVMYHWLPFDRRTLKRRLKASDAELKNWLRIDHVRPLAGLARKRGVDAAALQAELIEPWRRRTTDAQFAVLQRHTEAMFTQGHLASHMLFHTFHHAGIALSSREIFGLSLERYLRLRTGHMTNRGLARRLGIRPARAARRMNAVARRYVLTGKRRKLIAPAEARFLLDRIRARTGWWLNHKLVDERGVAPGIARRMHATHGRTNRACLVFAGVHDAKHQHSGDARH